MKKIADTFTLLPAGAVQMKGRLGEALDLSIENRLKTVDYKHLVQPFADRQEVDGRWRCEFWGKIVRSAIRSWRAKPDLELLQLIKQTVKDICDTQTEEGCISSYPSEKQTTDWDVWGRKYVILGLARYCNTVGYDADVVKVIVDCLDHLMTQVGPSGKKMIESGHHTGMAPSSILGAVIKVYWLTGEKRFLDYAEWIVAEGGSPVFQCVLDGVDPYKIGNGKAYEMTSCVEGMLELYRVTGREGYLKAIVKYFKNVVEQEIFVTGVGGLRDAVGEYWNEGVKNQTGTDLGGRGETCVTTTFIRFALNLLRMTGDATVADEIERSTYNGVLGEMVPDGSWWMHLNPTPLSAPAPKRPAGDQIKGYGEDCCLAQGPEALATGALSYAMKNGDNVVLNFYEEAMVNVDSGLTLQVAGEYPDEGSVKITVNLARSREFALLLRIPAWSKTTKSVKVNGEAVFAKPGTYCQIFRNWQDGDVVELELDMSLVVMPDPAGTGMAALRRGPILLVRDSRLGDLNKPYGKPTKATRAADVPGIKRVYALDDGSKVCDYASAGNLFSDDNLLRVFV
jgi:DUF1680 family protein